MSDPFELDNISKPLLISGVKRKYIKWIQKILYSVYADKIIPDNELTFYAKTIMSFDSLSEKNYISNKDIWSYKNIESVLSVVVSASVKEQNIKAIKEQRKNYRTIINDENFMVVQPLSAESAIKFGKGTKWCISASETKNFFDDYTSKGSKFYLCINKTSGEKDIIEIKYNGDIQAFRPENIKMNLIDFAKNKPKYIIDSINEYRGQSFIFTAEGTSDIVNMIARNPLSMSDKTLECKHIFDFFYNHSDEQRKIKLFAHSLDPKRLDSYYHVRSRFFLDCSNCSLNTDSYNIMLYKTLCLYSEQYLTFKIDLIVNFLHRMDVEAKFAKVITNLLYPEPKHLQEECIRDVESVFAIGDNSLTRSNLLTALKNDGVYKNAFYKLFYEHLFEPKTAYEYQIANHALITMVYFGWDLNRLIDEGFQVKKHYVL